MLSIFLYSIFYLVIVLRILRGPEWKGGRGEVMSKKVFWNFKNF
jgi:hypothetical protein